MRDVARGYRSDLERSDPLLRDANVQIWTNASHLSARKGSEPLRFSPLPAIEAHHQIIVALEKVSGNN
jgi:hypothetical protein